MYTSWKQKYIELMYPIDGKKINIEEAKILKQDNIPTSLYKYRSFDKNGYSIEILEKNKIYLSTPEEFNDPYDCSLSVMIQELTSYNDKIWKVYYDVGMSKEEVVELKSNNDFDYELTKMFLIKSKEYTIEKAEINAKIISEVIKKEYELLEHTYGNLFKKGMYITCFSENVDSILMWSHYSNDHKGFSIEYDFSQLGIKDVRSRLLEPIIYSEEVFDATPYIKGSKGNKNYNNLFSTYASTTKSKAWEYEREWRYILPLGPSEKKQYLYAPKPKAVYLGSKVTNENKNYMIVLAKKYNFQVYQMKMERNKFSLSYELIHS
jgi:hypothetical protein